MKTPPPPRTNRDMTYDDWRETVSNVVSDLQAHLERLESESEKEYSLNEFVEDCKLTVEYVTEETPH